MALPTAPQIAPLLTRSFIYLKNKQIEVIHENSKNLNQTKLIFRHALGNARYRGGLRRPTEITELDDLGEGVEVVEVAVLHGFTPY